MEIRTVGVVGLGTMGAGIAQVCVQAGVDDRRARGDARARRTRTRDDRALPGARRREGAADAGRDGRRARPASARDRPRRARGLRPRDRGDRRAGRCEEGAVRRARAHRLARGDPGDEHLGALRHGDRGGDRAARARRRHALLQPCAGDAAGRGRAHAADRPGRPRRGVRVREPGSARSRSAAPTRRASSSTAC